MDRPKRQPAICRFAIVTFCVALLPIAFGATVTTLDAGMAFPDWPSSDGHNIFLYPWLQAARDKFVEHGHRLAGILIGCLSIALTWLVWLKEPRRWVRNIGILILVGVSLQGVLGGVRVLAVDRVIAMIHGGFAACVLALMAILALVTGRSWFAVAVEPSGGQDVLMLKPIAVMTPMIVFAQYMLGGILRHLGRGMLEHLLFAFVTLALVGVTALVTRRNTCRWLRRAAYWLLGLMLVQMGLGTLAWITKFGWAFIGYVATQHSVLQVTLRTAHMVVGTLVFVAAINYSVRVFRLDAIHLRHTIAHPD